MGKRGSGKSFFRRIRREENVELTEEERKKQADKKEDMGEYATVGNHPGVPDVFRIKQELVLAIKSKISEVRLRIRYDYIQQLISVLDKFIEDLPGRYDISPEREIKFREILEPRGKQLITETEEALYTKCLNVKISANDISYYQNLLESVATLDNMFNTKKEELQNMESAIKGRKTRKPYGNYKYDTLRVIKEHYKIASDQKNIKKQEKLNQLHITASRLSDFIKLEDIKNEAIEI